MVANYLSLTFSVTMHLKVNKAAVLINLYLCSYCQTAGGPVPLFTV